MKLSFLELNGFRGYRKKLRIDFASGFTIIDGRNGVGKSTIFDAIEFALTGLLGKYEDQKASGETFADYVWWRGVGPSPAERYVSVGFSDSQGEISVTRREFQPPSDEGFQELMERIVDGEIAPSAPLVQLCTNAIIRDEQITKLSLDLKETDRYALLRDALGANDADSWIERAARIVSAVRRRVSAAEQEVAKTNEDLATASRRLDEVRSKLVSDSVLTESVARLRVFALTEASADELLGRVRERLASANEQIEMLGLLARQWDAIASVRQRLPELANKVSTTKAEVLSARAVLDSLNQTQQQQPASALAADSRALINLVSLGRNLALQDGHCPLCWHGQSPEEFERGMQQVEALAKRLDADAAVAAKNEQARRAGADKYDAARRAVTVAETAHTSATDQITKYDARLRALGFEVSATLEAIRERETAIRSGVERAQGDLRVLETVRLSSDLERAVRNEEDAKARCARAQERLSRVNRAEANAQILHDIARRAAAETLDHRLERVLPLMSELYRRLRPHPVWSDIEYSIRGDVRRFMTLQVGEALNPQFLFSSGQRRATGLAFLLSVNLSLAWSRWRTVLLDDPVQHIDDFRTVHLAELLAKLVSEGRQVICAVEDAALADLLCRRLPIEHPTSAKRMGLGPDEEGALVKLYEQQLPPLRYRTLGLQMPTAAPG